MSGEGFTANTNKHLQLSVIFKYNDLDHEPVKYISYVYVTTFEGLRFKGIATYIAIWQSTNYNCYTSLL